MFYVLVYDNEQRKETTSLQYLGHCTLLVVYKSLNGLGPKYIVNMLEQYHVLGIQNFLSWLCLGSSLDRVKWHLAIMLQNDGTNFLSKLELPQQYLVLKGN